MKWPVVIALALSLQACNRQEAAPVDKVVESAEDIAKVVTKQQEIPLAKGPYAPRDQCFNVKGSDAFRVKLAQAVKDRDVDGMVALAASDIKLDFNGGSSSEELRNRLEDDQWNLWEELDKLMALGCAANDQGGITLPWYFAQDFGPILPQNGMIVTGENVRVMKEPHADAETLKRVSWDIVKIDHLMPDDRYQPVTLSDGEQGYIDSDKLRSLLDYRLVASSRNGKWSITSFTAGD